MEKTFFLLLCFFLLMFLISVQPFVMVLCLISFVLISSVLFLAFFSKSWMMILILLVYLGGVLVLFLYLTSLNPKKNFFGGGSGVWMFFPFVLFLFFNFKKNKIYWGSSSMSSMFFSFSENFFLLFFIIFILVLFLINISFFLSSVFSPYRKV